MKTLLSIFILMAGQAWSVTSVRTDPGDTIATTAVAGGVANSTTVLEVGAAIAASIYQSSSTQLTVSKVDATGAGDYVEQSGTNYEQASHDDVNSTYPVEAPHVVSVRDPRNPLSMDIPSTSYVPTRLVYGTRRNELYQSEDQSGTPWITTNMTITDNNQPSPYGDDTADSVRETTANATHNGYQEYNGVANGIEEISIFARGVNRRYFGIEWWDYAAGTILVVFDLDNGLIGDIQDATGNDNVQVLYPNIELAPHGYWRCTFWVRTGSNTRRALNWGGMTKNDASDNTNIEIYAGNTSNGYDLWGASVITGVNYPLTLGPYIPAIAGATTDTSSTQYIGNVFIDGFNAPLPPGTNNLGKMDIVAADFAVANGSSANTLINNGFADVAVTNSTLRQGTLILKSNLTDAIKFSDDTIRGIQAVGALGLYVVNGQTLANAVYVVATVTSFDESGVKGIAQHVKVVGSVTTSPREIVIISASFTPLTATYNIGDTFGPKLVFTNSARVDAGAGVLDSVKFIDTTTNAPALDLILWDGPSTGDGDGLTWGPSNVDMLKTIAVIKITAADWSKSAVNAVVSQGDINEQFKITTGRNIEGQMVIREAKTFTAGETFKVRIGIRQN